MIDLNSFVVSGRNFAQLMEAVGVVCRALPPELGKRLHEIRKDYIARYKFEDVHEKMNNRAVAQIFAEYQSTGAKPIASGQLGGVRYELHERPSGTAAQHHDKKSH